MEGMRQYKIKLTGTSPLIMHYDNIEWADKMAEWLLDPVNKKKSKAGDDRTPAWTWLGSLYHDNEHIALPGDNLQRCMMEAGAMVPVPNGKHGKTFKSQTQSGCSIPDFYWPLLVNGKPIETAKLAALEGDASVPFSEHKSVALEHGFSLFMKRARIQNSKHVRVRPRFDQWSVEGVQIVLDEQLTTDIMRQIWTFAGKYKGLCDWRPGGRTPGPFGMFEAEVAEL